MHRDYNKACCFEVSTFHFLMVVSCFLEYLPKSLWLSLGIGFGKHFCFVFGSTSGGLGGQKVAKLAKTNRAKTGIRKIGSEEAWPQSGHTGLGARTGERGEVNLSPGVRRFGKSFGRQEGRKKGRRIYTLDWRVGGLLIYVIG